MAGGPGAARLGRAGRSASSPACSPCSSACRSSPSSSGRSSTGSLRDRARLAGRPRRAVAEPRSRRRSAWSSRSCLGLPLAFVLARRSFRGKGLLEAVVDLPIVLPPSVAGLALLLVFGRRGLLSAPFELVRDLGPVHDDRRRSWPRSSCRRRSSSARRGPGSPASIATSRMPRGSTAPSERQLFRSITVPLAGAALAAGLVMTWARSLGEFGATIMFAGNVEGRTQTLPLVVYSGVPGRRPRRVDRRRRDPGAGRVRRAGRGPRLPLGPGARQPRPRLRGSGVAGCRNAGRQPEIASMASGTRRRSAPRR